MGHIDILFIALIGVSISLVFGGCSISFKPQKKDPILSHRKIVKLEKQLPMFLDSISSSLSAGNSLQQSLESSTKNNCTPLDAFFISILHRVRSGMTLDASIELEARCIPGGSLSLALISMAFSYRSGSNMIESLTLLSKICRERQYLRKKILARTAQSRAQGYVLIFVPILFMSLLFIVSPQNMIPVLQSKLGKSILLFAVALQCLGGITIHSMLKQDIL